MEDVSIEMYMEFACAIPKESFSFHQVPCVDLSSLKILVIFLLLHRTTFKKISFLENFAITLEKKNPVFGEYALRETGRCESNTTA